MDRSDIKTLTGLKYDTVLGLERIQSLILVHDLAENAMKKNAKSYDIEIRNIGIIRVKKRKGRTEVDYEFIPEQRFHNEVKGAVFKGKSPLEKAIDDVYVEQINEQYKDVLS